MAEEMKNLPTENEGEIVSASEKKSEKTTKLPEKVPFFTKVGNFFKKVGKKIAKFTVDTVHEMKKVVWTPVAELKKSTLIVVVTVLCVAVAIAIIDAVFSWAINGIAGLFPII